MPNIKTAISIEKPLFEEMEALAHEMEISRSRLFMLAVRDFIEQHKSRKMLDALNAVYSEEPTKEEKERLVRMKFKYAQIVKDKW